MLEMKHILAWACTGSVPPSRSEGTLDLFICPVEEESIIEVGSFRQTAREIDRILEVSP
jgi:hypothetical protein